MAALRFIGSDASSQLTVCSRSARVGLILEHAAGESLFDLLSLRTDERRGAAVFFSHFDRP